MVAMSVFDVQQLPIFVFEVKVLPGLAPFEKRR